MASQNAYPKLHFKPVEDPFVLLPILKGRYPHSCFLENQVKKHKDFQGKITFYIAAKEGGNVELNEDTWIVSQYIRQDHGAYFSISAPVCISSEDEIPKEIFDCFSSGGKLINWNNRFLFVALEIPISRMIVEISANIKLRVTHINPCYLYYMDTDKAINLDIGNLESGEEIRRLDAQRGDHDFIVKTWKFATPETKFDIPLCLQGYVSSGVFLEDGQCASGVYCAGYGCFSGLYTLKEQRGKGYAKMVMRYAFKETAKEGCVPCSTVECTNKISNDFHKKLGAKVASTVNWIVVQELVVD